jgi:ribosomal protein L3 glutamine methyltransferase
MSDTPLGQLSTIRDYVRWAASQFEQAGLFYGHGTDNAWDDAAALVLQSVYLQWNVAAEAWAANLTLAEQTMLIERVNTRVALKTPVPYLTGQAWFCGLQFEVNHDVLIPRSPIGELIEKGFEPWLMSSPTRILDMCSGSGCIGIACAYGFEWAEVDLAEISTAAIVVAERNIVKHGLSDRVRTIQSDCFNSIEPCEYDLIVSNPPYVNSEDLAAMPSEFHNEPSLALGSGEDGLDFTRRFLRQAASYLSDEGVLVVEVGNSWPALEKAFPKIPFTWVEFERGGHGVFVLSKHDLVSNI